VTACRNGIRFGLAPVCLRHSKASGAVAQSMSAPLLKSPIVIIHWRKHASLMRHCVCIRPRELSLTAIRSIRRMTYTPHLKLTYKMKNPQKPIEASAGMAEVEGQTPRRARATSVPRGTMSAKQR
jgi:hypothetical protein